MTTPPPPPSFGGSTPSPEPSPWAPQSTGDVPPPPAPSTPVPPPATQVIPGPAEPPPPAEAEPKPAKERDYRSIILISVIVVAVALAAILGVELYARQRSSSLVNKATSCLIQDGASVSFGAEPLVLQYLGDHIDKMTIRTAGNQIRQAKEMTVAITLRDISLQKTSDSLGTIGQMDVSVIWPTDGMTKSLQSVLPAPLGSLVGDVKTSSATGMVTISAAGGLASVTTKPVIDNGLVVLQSTNVNAVVGLPRELVQPALDAASKGIVGEYPMGLKATNVSVTDDGLQVDLSSTNVPMKPSNEPCLQNLTY